MKGKTNRLLEENTEVYLYDFRVGNNFLSRSHTQNTHKEKLTNWTASKLRLFSSKGTIKRQERQLTNQKVFPIIYPTKDVYSECIKTSTDQDTESN